MRVETIGDLMGPLPVWRKIWERTMFGPEVWVHPSAYANLARQMGTDWPAEPPVTLRVVEQATGRVLWERGQ